jgi:hypothetical protein
MLLAAMHAPACVPAAEMACTALRKHGVKKNT